MRITRIHPILRTLLWLCLFPLVVHADPILTPTILISLAISAGVSAASYGIDYLLMKNQKVSPVDRGKIDDPRISIAAIGATIPKAWGTVRVAPIWVWHTPVIDTPVVSGGHGGGKGMPKPPAPTVTDHVYTTTLAGVFHDGPISNVSRIWFDTDLVYNTSATYGGGYEAESGVLAGGAHSVVDVTCSNGHRVTGIGSGGTCRINGINAYTGAGQYEISIQYVSGSDLTLYYAVNGGGASSILLPSSDGFPTQEIVTVTLSSGSANYIIFSNAGATAPDIDRIQVAPAISLTGGLGDTRGFTGLVNPSWTHTANQDATWASNNYVPTPSGTGVYSASLSKYGQAAIRVYTGTETQTADSAIIAAKGAANAPAYRGFAYIVIENLQLVGGRVPNVTIEFNQGTTDLAQIVQDHYTLVGVDSANLNLTELVGTTVTGWLLVSRNTAAQSMTDLQTVYQFDLPEVDGKVYGVPRDGNSVITIPYADLRAHDYGSEMPPADATVTDPDPVLLPKSMDVNYLDPVLDYHNNTQQDLEIVSTGAQDNSTVSVPWVASADEAKALAVTLRHKPFMEGRTFDWSTTLKYLKLFPGRVVTLATLNASHDVRITEMPVNLPPGVVGFKGVRQHASIYSPNTNGAASGFEAPIVRFPGATKGVIIDGPVLRAEDLGDGTQPVVYVAACGRGAGAWLGGFLYEESPIGSGSYELLTPFTQSSSIGVTRSALTTVSDPSVWDRTHTLTIDFYSNTTLSSHSETELLQNAELNLLAVNNSSGVEYIQFTTAASVTPTTGFQTAWTISTFLRGRAGTDSNVGIHGTSDDVVVMDSTVKPRRYNISDIGV